MALTGRIEKVNYTPLLCSALERKSVDGLDKALRMGASFILALDSGKEFAVSHWVSPKRTRSYPYVRVYDTLEYTGTRVTIIPVTKDEGLTSDGSGDRDFLQWDTISFMSLLNVYAILSCYCDAERSVRYPGKVTKQCFSLPHLLSQFEKLSACKSSALHWNIEQVSSENLESLFKNAMNSYSYMERKFGIKFHDRESAIRKILKITSSRNSFIQSSRDAAHRAQSREVLTIQPKENTEGQKQGITIRNYLGGEYFLTVDEFTKRDGMVRLVEAKHTKRGVLPSWNDIKDGLLKLVLFTNLTNVMFDDEQVRHEIILKLTSPDAFSLDRLRKLKADRYRKLTEEAQINGFRIEHSN